MRNTNVLIIGGGIIGSSIAYNLAVKGIKKITVLDKFPEPGLGSTGKATGGFRCQFSTGINIQLSLLGRKKLLTFNDAHDIDPGFLQAGYLFIASNQSESDSLINSQKVQRDNGLNEVQVVSRDDIYRLNPFLELNDEIYGGVFSSTDGFLKPMNILTGYKNSAEKLGVEFHYNTDCTGFTISDNGGVKRIVGAITSAGNIQADYFINAAGAWAGVISDLAGIDIPVVPQRREIAVLHEKNLFNEVMPMTIFIHDGFHFRQRDGNVLLLHPEISSAPPFNIGIDNDWLKVVKKLANKRVKNISDKSIDKAGSWAGLYEMSPDKHCIIGTHPKLSNFYFANGSSGHGVMHSPAIGEIISELIVSGSFTKFDIHPLRVSRFEENDLNISSEYL